MNHNTSKEAKQKISVFDMIVYGMMLAAIVFIIIQTFMNQFTNIGFRVALGAWILIAIGISDYIGPLFTGELNKYNTRQMVQYLVASIVDGIAYMCLYVFIIFVGDFAQLAHYFFLVAAILLFALRFYIMRRIGEGETRTEERVVTEYDTEESGTDESVVTEYDTEESGTEKHGADVALPGTTDEDDEDEADSIQTFKSRR